MIDQAKVLREPNGEAETELLELHRSLYPEQHEAYWQTQPESEWPYGWGGPGEVFSWSADTIEWAAEGIERGLRNAGVLAP
jgi:hypothetical protein